MNAIQFRAANAWTSARFRRIIPALALAALIAQADAALRPEEIHKLVSPSVATIRDIDGHGSAVILNREGLILTNYHVVASGIPLSVSVKVRKGNSWEDRTFENVEISKVHPEYDLALLQLDAKGIDLQPAKLLRAGEKVATGAACFAIGHPGGADGTALEHSITEGLVSASSREIEGLDYIQTSAALNPGNSGGAVTDSEGRVIGIATLRLEEADNIGFAIPVQKLKLDQFVAPQKRKANPELAVRYEKEANRIAELAEQLEGEDRALAVLAAAYFYKKCMESVPNHPAPYNNVGTMYFRLQQDDIARRYLERALQIRPLYASSMSMLGIIHVRGGGDEALAEDLWFRGATDKDSPNAASDCVENLAISYIKRKEAQAAAYCIRWANILAAAPEHRKAVRSSIWEQGVQTLSESQFLALKQKETGFSKADLEAFLKGDVSIPTTAEAPKPDEIPSAPTKMDAKRYIEFARKKANVAVEVPAGGIIRPLPSKPEDVIMGYAGTCLLMKFPDLMKLGVFDLTQAKIIKYIDLAEKDAIFAAGGKVLLIYLPETKRFELWDMETWTRKKEVALRSDIGISAMGMGLLNHNFAVVARSEGDSQAQDKVAILSIPDCQLTVPRFRQSEKGMNLFHFFAHLGENARVMVEENGIAALVTGSGRGFIKLGNHQTVDASYLHSGGSMSASIVPGGAEVVVENRDVYPAEDDKGLLQKADHKADRGVSREFVAGVYGYRGIVEIARPTRNGDVPQLRVLALPHLSEVYSQPIEMELLRKLSMGGQRRLFASAYVNRCAIVDDKSNSVHLFSLDTVAADVVGQPVPGTLLVRKLVFAEGTKVEIESAPEGLSYDAASSEIRWQIPKEQARGVEVSVILNLTDAEGNPSYHVEKIAIP